jgi:hypothetical protein
VPSPSCSKTIGPGRAKSNFSRVRSGSHDTERGLASGCRGGQACKDLGSRPEELLNAFRVVVYSLPAGAGPDATLQIIVATVRAGIANAELVRIQDIGPLAEAIFDRIASSEETQTRGI